MSLIPGVRLQELLHSDLRWLTLSIANIYIPDWFVILLYFVLTARVQFAPGIWSVKTIFLFLKFDV